MNIIRKSNIAYDRLEEPYRFILFFIPFMIFYFLYISHHAYWIIGILIMITWRILGSVK